MSAALTYLPAYLGLYFSLLLALACNAFLDIWYGSFGVEVVIWAAIFAYTLSVGWRQRGQVSDFGRDRQKAVLVVGILVTVLVFVQIWGIMRAGVYLLAVLQAANNCVTTSRRTLHLGLLVSVVMVMFAATHPRADWTMLFYLLPYLVAVVFALVAEQISRRARDMSRAGLGQSVLGGQGIAILAATGAILLTAGVLYALTPQVTRPYLEWRFGYAAKPDAATQGGAATGAQAPEEAGQGGGRGSPSGPGQMGAGGTGSGKGGGMELGSGLPSVGEMRAAAKRKGMPRWQADAINALADLAQGTQMVLAPVRQTLEEALQEMKQWLQKHLRDLLSSLLALIGIALLAALWRLLKEARVDIWLRAQFDFLRLGLFAFHAPGNQGASQYFRALERLLLLHDAERAANANSREYLAQMVRRHGHLRRELTELTLIYESSRYAKAPVDAAAVRRMRKLYREVHDKVGLLTV
ncbi:MAG: DUF4129 domain-containing protein [Rhodocyclales bacterium]|nr:DUF4129 domain-containing protein [Rhodocyclales bacterium]